VEEQPETPKILEELSKSNSAKPVSRQHTTARRRFVIVLCIFSVMVAGVALIGYEQWMASLRLQDLREQNQQLSATLLEQNAEIEALRAAQSEPVVALPVDDTAMRELEAQLNGEISRLRQQLLTLQQQQNATSSEISLEWKILEAEYLLGIANQKLQLQADVPSAIALLEDADAALLASGSSGVFAVRQTIATDLELLREVDPVDHAGIYLRFDALISQVQQIDLLDSMRENFENSRNRESQPVTIGASSNGVIAASLDFLSSVFVWRKWDETPVAMIAPGQDTVIKQNLRLVLEQAQLALLLRDATLDRRSVENGIAWLQRYTSPDSAVGRTMSSSLNELLALDINPPLPSLDSTLLAISQLTASER